MKTADKGMEAFYIMIIDLRQRRACNPKRFRYSSRREMSARHLSFFRKSVSDGLIYREAEPTREECYAAYNAAYTQYTDKHKDKSPKPCSFIPCRNSQPSLFDSVEIMPEEAEIEAAIELLKANGYKIFKEL